MGVAICTWCWQWQQKAQPLFPRLFSTLWFIKMPLTRGTWETKSIQFLKEDEGNQNRKKPLPNMTETSWMWAQKKWENSLKYRNNMWQIIWAINLMQQLKQHNFDVTRCFLIFFYQSSRFLLFVEWSYDMHISKYITHECIVVDQNGEKTKQNNNNEDKKKKKQLLTTLLRIQWLQ